MLQVFLPIFGMLFGDLCVAMTAAPATPAQEVWHLADTNIGYPLRSGILAERANTCAENSF
jgi:hypothetical protein